MIGPWSGQELVPGHLRLSPSSQLQAGDRALNSEPADLCYGVSAASNSLSFGASHKALLILGLISEMRLQG